LTGAARHAHGEEIRRARQAADMGRENSVGAMFHGVSSFLLIGANSMLVNRPVTRGASAGRYHRRRLQIESTATPRRANGWHAINVYLLNRMVLNQTSSGNYTIVDRVHGD
jgi:hypothetical protein